MTWVCVVNNQILVDENGVVEFECNELGRATKELQDAGLRVYKDFYFIIKGGQYEKESKL